MIKERYVSLGIARLLREKGFDEICNYEWGVHDIDGDYELQKWVINNGQVKNSELIDGAYAAPTHQMALRWLREIHDLHIIVYPYKAFTCRKYCCQVYKSFNNLGCKQYTNETLSSYEESCRSRAQIFT